MAVALRRLGWLPALPALAWAYGCEDGACAAHLLQVASQKVGRGTAAPAPAPPAAEAVGGRAAAVVPPATEIKVIVAGSPRSASTSLECALLHLGYNPNRGDLPYRELGSLAKPWVEWKENITSFEVPVQQLLSMGYNATTSDFPTGNAWEELFERFPKAKVIDLLHPNGSKGFIKDAGDLGLLACDIWYMKYFMSCCDLSHVMTYQARLDACQLEYEEQHERIQARIPREQLLIYDVSQGWEPLAKFLEVSAPEIPFPRIHGGHIEMCYPNPDETPAVLYNDMVNAYEGLLDPETWAKAEELERVTLAKERVLLPGETSLLAAYELTKAYQAEARAQLANATAGGPPAL